MNSFIARFRNLVRRLFTADPKHDRLIPESLFVITVTDVEVRCREPKDGEKRVAWNDIAGIAIETNDSGPWGIDVMWIVGGLDGQIKLVIPHGATGEDTFIAAIQKLPGFDHEAVIAAMGCTDNRVFLCWKRP